MEQLLSLEYIIFDWHKCVVSWPANVCFATILDDYYDVGVDDIIFVNLG